MKIEGYNLDSIRKLILNSGKMQVVVVDEEDVDYLFDSVSSVAFQVTKGDNLQDALDKIELDRIDSDFAKKAIFVVCSQLPYKMPIADFSKLLLFTGMHLPTANVRWGLAANDSGEESSHVTVVAVTTH